MRGLTVERPPTQSSQRADLLASLVEELRATDALCGAVTRSRVATGPLLSRVAMSSTGGQHLVLDLAPSTPPWVPWLVGPAESDAPPGWESALRASAAADGGVAAVLARPVGPSPIRAWYHRTPWPPAMLAEVATGAVDGPLPTPATFAALGAALARSHTSGRPADHRVPQPLQRVLDAADRLTAEQRILADRVLAGRDLVVPVHGQPALAHVLVPSSPEATDVRAEPRETGPCPVAVLTGWSQRLGGSAALDLGHLLGDMTEIAVLAGLTDPARGNWLRARLIDVRDGYCAAGSAANSDPRFWNRVADGAVLRLLDHRATLVGLLGPDAAPVAIADRVAAHLASSAFRAKGFRP